MTGERGPVLITGGLGYVGGRIARLLGDALGWPLRLGTRQPAGAPPAWMTGAQTVTIDLWSDEVLEAACRGVRTVIHLAGMNELDSQADEEGAIRVNGLGTLRMLRAAERAGVERFLYFSTAHVYGSPLAGTITETTVPRPTHPYAISHRLGEDVVLAARAQGSIQGIVLRLSNSLGAPAHAGVNRWTLVGNDLCRQAATTGRLVLRSSGLQWRDFIALSDVARAVAHLARCPAQACGDGLFNVGGECPLRIIDVAERVAQRCAEVLGFTPDIHRPPPRDGEETPPLDYGIEKLKSTGFVLEGKIDDEIDGTLKFCQQGAAQVA